MNLVSIEENKNNIVVKHQDLIWEARYRLSELGIKVVAILISMIKVNDEDFKEYHLKINDFKELIGSSSKKTYEYVDIMTDELMRKPFKVGDEKFNWVYYAKYHEGDNYVTLKIAPELKPYLLKIQGKFLEYNITNILPLKSSYVIRLYELFKSKWSEYQHYHKNAKSYTFELKISWLKEHFKIPASYQYSSHIKERIIDKAKRQFKEKTDIQFEYKEQKIGRKVDRLIVTIKDNSKGSNDFLADLKSFIAYMRKNCVNKDILQAADKDTQKVMMISVSSDGYLYDKYSTKEIPKERAKEIWEKLHELAKENNLSCFK
jgi:plasmid replication initiation protein